MRVIYEKIGWPGHMLENVKLREDADSIPPNPPVEQSMPSSSNPSFKTNLTMNREPSMHRPRGVHDPRNKAYGEEPEKELSDEETKKAKETHCKINPYVADLTGECKPDDKKPTIHPQQCKSCSYGGQTYFVDPNGNVRNTKGQIVTGQTADKIKSCAR